MAEEVTYADFEAKQKELIAIEEALKAKGMEFVDANGKPLYKSKIFWANILALGVTVANQFFGVALNAEELTIALGAVLPAINILLRYVNKDISGVVN
jgi:hypothetical protein